MKMTLREVSRRRNNEGDANAQRATRIRLQKDYRGYPQQHPAADAEARRIHLLTAGPQLGGGGWSQSWRRTVIVERSLGVKGEKEHESAEAYGQRPPQVLISHDSKIHGQGCRHPNHYYTCEKQIRKHVDANAHRAAISSGLNSISCSSQPAPRATLHSRNFHQWFADPRSFL